MQAFLKNDCTFLKTELIYTQKGKNMKKNKPKKEVPHTQDVLGAYPEKEQVDAFPERRYIKMTRFLTIVAIVNLAILIALSGFYFYEVKNVDIKIFSKNRSQMYRIDPERKVLLPIELSNTSVHAMQLVMESTIRTYLTERYSSVLDADTMQRRWGNGGYIALLSSIEVMERFVKEREVSWNEVWRNRISRDTHIYSLRYIHGDLWEAYIETFDFVLDENLKKKCDCSDNSYECLSCKEKNTVKRQRKKIWLRANFIGQKNLFNPFGIMIYAYYPASIPLPKKGERKTFWDLPPALRPRI